MSSEKTVQRNTQLNTWKRLIIIAAIVLIVLLIAIVLFIYAWTYLTDAVCNPFTIELCTQDSRESIKAWDNGRFTLYVFLPSYFEKANVTFSTENDFFIGLKRFHNGDSLSSIDINKKYIFYQTGQFMPFYRLVFIKSQNVPTMYINTLSGTMDNIYADKNLKEYAEISIINNDSSIDYFGNGKDTIKGRGNSTWLRTKKPFQIKLDLPSALLGMQEERKWILLANAYDDTNLRNKMVFDLGSQTALQWTPACRYVCLYLNGNYNGLYLLTEKVEVSEKRLSLQENEISFLVEMNETSKLDGSETVITTKGGKIFEVHYPKNVSGSALKKISTKIQELEDSIIEGNLSGIDLDSFVRRMLVDEIFSNIDADRNSSYYFYSEGTNTFYAGPLWDYDLCMNNTPPTWEAEDNPPNVINAANLPWYSKCYSNEKFYTRLKEIYKEEYLPLLNELKEREFENLRSNIQEEGSEDFIRWKGMFKYFDGVETNREEDINKMYIWLTQRIDYLNSQWMS